MKKIVCILMAIILAASLTIPASAGLVPLPVTDKEFAYEFAEYCDWFSANVLDYDELYYHYTDEGEIDWALVTGYTNAESPILLYRVVGDRLISIPTCGVPFDAHMGVYDVADECFYDVTDDVLYRYDDLPDVYLEMGVGRLIGDIDRDDELTIIDVTYMQRCDVQITDYPADDEVEYRYEDDQLRYYSDFNRDGDRDILDATCLQRYLVGLYHWSDPIITNVQFEDIDNVYSHPHATVSVTGGTAPYTYCYKIKGIFHQYSDYGADLGEYDFDYEDMAPGSMNFSTGYFDENTTTIPVRALTYGDTFTLVVTVKDSAGRVSKPVSKQFVNMDATVIYV